MAWSGAAVLAGVGAVVAGSLLVGVLVSFRGTGLVLGAGLAALAVARLLLPVRALGPLVVRSRPVDVAVASVLAVALVVLSLLAPASS